MATPNISLKPTIGECEACLPGCLGKNTEVYKMHGNMLMCQVCRDAELKLVADTKVAQKLLEDSRVIDNSARIKQDIFLLKTTAAIEIHGAVLANRDIPEADKQLVYTQMCQERYLHFKELVKGERAQLTEHETEMRMWQVQVQDSASKLRTDQRAQFRELDSNYEPTPIARPRPVAVAKAPKQSRAEVAAALEFAEVTYGFDKSLIKMMAEAQKVTIQVATERYAKQLGLIKD